MRRVALPLGKSFAFTILDDTDVATVENVEPIYRLLAQLGLRTTKTVWAVDCPEGSKNYRGSQTLDCGEYREFVLDLRSQGFEMASHGATMETSDRARTLRALERFREVFGHDPRVFANHALNRENLYWGVHRFDDPCLRVLYGAFSHVRADYFQGHCPNSPLWWGDHCRQRVTYVRNLTFSSLDISRINPSMPYHDPRRPLVNWWFSTSDANDARQFVEAMRPARLDALERGRGICILSTHFAKNFVRGGTVDAAVVERLEDVASRDGWFCPVGELLDWLRAQRGAATIPPMEWRGMQWRYLNDVLAHKAKWTIRTCSARYR